MSALLLQKFVVFIEKAKDGGQIETLVVYVAQTTSAPDTFAHVQTTVEIDHTFTVTRNALTIAGGNRLHATHFALVQVEKIVLEKVQGKIRR